MRRTRRASVSRGSVLIAALRVLLGGEEEEGVLEGVFVAGGAETSAGHALLAGHGLEQRQRHLADQGWSAPQKLIQVNAV